MSVPVWRYKNQVGGWQAMKVELARSGLVRLASMISPGPAFQVVVVWLSNCQTLQDVSRDGLGGRLSLPFAEQEENVQRLVGESAGLDVQPEVVTTLAMSRGACSIQVCFTIVHKNYQGRTHVKSPDAAVRKAVATMETGRGEGSLRRW